MPFGVILALQGDINKAKEDSKIIVTQHIVVNFLIQTFDENDVLILVANKVVRAEDLLNIGIDKTTENYT